MNPVARGFGWGHSRGLAEPIARLDNGGLQWAGGMGTGKAGDRGEVELA